jgi:hypothetical protein
MGMTRSYVRFFDLGTIHLISTMGCNFTELSDPIGSDCRIRSDSNTMDPLVIPQAESYEFHRIPTKLLSNPIKIRLSNLITWERENPTSDSNSWTSITYKKILSKHRKDER